MATFGVIFAAWYPQIAYCVIIFLAGLTAINPELIEAGKLDGARGFTMFRKIVLPQLAGNLYLRCGYNNWGASEFRFGAGDDRGAAVVRRSGTVHVRNGFGENGGNYGFGATISVILFMIMLVFIIFFVTNMVRQADD